MASLREELQQSRPFFSAREEALLALLRTADVVRRWEARLFAPHGITPQQYNVLRILRGAGPAGLPTLAIAGRLVERTPGITRLLDRLVRKGLIARRPAPSDRRSVVCRITEAGLALLAELDPVVGRAVEQAAPDLMDEDLGRLAALLERVRAGFTVRTV